jgi:nitroreductase
MEHSINGIHMLRLIKSRQSDRQYSDRPVEEEKISRIVEAGRMSPSACNAQPWKFIVVSDRDLIREIAVAAAARLTGMNKFVGEAAALIVVVREKANFSSRIGATIKNKDYSLIDIGIAAGNMCLQSASEGLGSCIIGWFDERQLRKILAIPSLKRVELIITLGYPTGEYRVKKRKEIQQVVSFNKY